MNAVVMRRVAARFPMRWLIAGWFFGLLLAGLPAWAAEDDSAQAAEDVVARFHSALAGLRELGNETSLEQRAGSLEAVVLATHDLPRMGRLAIPRRYWRQLDESDRATYLDAFQRFTVMTYASRFASIGADALSVAGSDVIGETQVDVHAVLERPDGSGSVALDYSLRLVEEAFRIVSIVADGGNELNIMASEHAAILETGSIADVIAALEARIAAL